MKEDISDTFIKTTVQRAMRLPGVYHRDHTIWCSIPFHHKLLAVRREVEGKCREWRCGVKKND